jgi:carbamoyltransferase
MIILGLHFGHDGAACVLKDGKIIAYVMRERESGIKHALGVTTHEVNLALSSAKIRAEEIDAFAITSTQGIEILYGLVEGLEIIPIKLAGDPVPEILGKLLQEAGLDYYQKCHFGLRNILDPNKEKSLISDATAAYFPEKEAYLRGEIAALGANGSVALVPEFEASKDLDILAKTSLRSVYENHTLRKGFHHNFTINFRGLTRPGYFIQHHMAHAASSFYRSGFSDAVVFSHDGHSGENFDTGIIAIGYENSLVALAPHNLILGSLYENIAISLLNSPFGAPGKMMGLAPYGKPRYYDSRFAVNKFEAKTRLGMDHVEAWYKWISENTANHPQKDFLLSREHITAPINADIAASTQKLLNETMLRTINTSFHLARNSDLLSNNLCLSGGTALNCPANSYVFTQGPFEQIFVEPNCTDDGLSIGSSLYVYHHLYENKLDKETLQYNQSPYQGPLHSEEKIHAAVTNLHSKIIVETPENFAECAAKDLAADLVIAWFEGRSEIGLRALGHRSIMAHPGVEKNWRRVNQIKKREEWRPFAPAVLAEHASAWFSHTPLPSPYMLFTGYVRSQNLPAITHVDQSGRLQTVSEKDGRYYDVIRSFYEITGLPVVMNTSLNGPKQPIIEYPEDALNFLLETEIDVLYMYPFRIKRALS